MAGNVDLLKTLNDVSAWQRRNFPDALPHQPLLGVLEELGELAHAHLKMEQGIRGSFAQHFDEKRDAVGDMIIYLIHYCNLNGLVITDALAEAWSIVQERNWRENPLTGCSGSISEFVRQEEEGN